MHVLATYFHGAPLLGEGGLSAGALLAVPVLGSVLWGIERRRRARARD